MFMLLNSNFCTKTALFLSTEALFGSLLSLLFKIEPFTLNLLFGGLIILFSIFASEINFSSKKQVFKLDKNK